MQEKLKDPIRSIFSSPFFCVSLTKSRAVITEKFHPVKFFTFKTLAWCMPRHEAPSAEIGCDKHSWLSYNTAKYREENEQFEVHYLVIVLQHLQLSASE